MIKWGLGIMIILYHHFSVDTKSYKDENSILDNINQYVEASANQGSKLENDLLFYASSISIEKYNLQNAKNTGVNSQNNKIVYFLSSFLLLIAIVALIFYIKYRVVKKHCNSLLKENKQLVEAKIEAEKLTNIKSQFISTVSHELRTPLYGVVGISTLLLEDTDIADKHKKLLNSLKFSGDYLLGLINKVLKISKIESNNEKITKTPTNLAKLSQNLLFSFEYQAKNKKK